jgi:hypothetical protein
MEIWPEGTSRSIANNAAAYGSVLMSLNNTSSGVTLTNSQQTAVPSGKGLSFSNQTSKTAAGTLAAGTSITQQHIIEGYNISSLANQEFSLIFYVRSSVASNRSLAIRNGTSTHSYVKQYNISAANTWELKALSFPALSSCPGALNFLNAAGLRVTWNIVSGTTFQTSSLNQWVAGNFVSGPGEDTTWLTGTTHSFDIAGLMVLPGNWEGLNAAQYNFVRAGRNFEDEVAMSQRYFSDAGAGWVGSEETATSFSMAFGFPVVMRTNPILSIISSNVSSRIVSGSIDRTLSGSAINTYSTSARGAFVLFTNSGGNVVGRMIVDRAGASVVTADARF